MNNLSKHPLLKQCYGVMQAIEMCGASPALTAAVIKAGELLEAIDKQLHPATYHDQSIKQEIQAKRLTAPMITQADIEANIASEWYINPADAISGVDGFHPPVPAVHPLRRLTFCVLVLRNGFTVTGESACVSVENFDEQKGRKYARENAVEKIWPLMGYELRSKLARAAEAEAMPRPTSDAPILHIPV